MASSTQTANSTIPMNNSNDDAFKGALCIRYLYDMTQTPVAHAFTAGGKMMAENFKLAGVGALNPKSQAVVITSVMIRKALHMAGLAETSQGIACAMAVAQLGTTAAVLTAKVGATTVVSAGVLGVPATFFGLAVLALESYKVGNACFVRDGNVSHKFRGR